MGYSADTISVGGVEIPGYTFAEVDNVKGLGPAYSVGHFDGICGMGLDDISVDGVETPLSWLSPLMRSRQLLPPSVPSDCPSFLLSTRSTPLTAMRMPQALTSRSMAKHTLCPGLTTASTRALDSACSDSWVRTFLLLLARSSSWVMSSCALTTASSMWARRGWVSLRL